ncbi:MAG TPA: protein kinase [Longimicrobiales bacterium]|nr:protein kinase [Longimicrobiales bacterium]
MSDFADRLDAALGGAYRIERELGAGGTATVWLAHDLRHDRRVALKVLRPELAAVVGADRFLREIRVTANLQHPHILPLLDSGESGGYLWYAMPWVAGESLRHRLRQVEALSIDEAVGIVRHVASALDYSHRHGILHRDIKPENVLLHEGEAVVSDFGIALALSEAGARFTGTGLALGTPGYMSPEQVSGDVVLDARSDVYALGALLYEMLTSEPPFSGPPHVVMGRMLTESPPPLRAKRSDAPPAIEAAVARAMATDREARFETAGAFADAISIAARPVTRGLPRRVRRAAIALTAVLAVSAAVVGWKVWQDASRAAWVRDEALPTIERLIGDGRHEDAFLLALEASEVAPADRAVRTLLERAGAVMNLNSDPPGARVRYRPYVSSDTTWMELGTTPIENAWLAWAQARLRFDLDGHRPLEIGVRPAGSLLVSLPAADSSRDMVDVPDTDYELGDSPTFVAAFRLDRLEVTNTEYQRFVDAGGYRDRALWTSPFEEAGVEPPTQAMVAGFTDQTGQAGPSTWQVSRYAEGTGDHPVGGVSWYEAVAFCAWSGARLPTLYHWKAAASVDVWDDILKFANFGNVGTIAVGSSAAVGPFGTLDMAGNVREWVWNETRGGRYILGGAWNEAEYLYSDSDAIVELSREPVNGFRCAVYEPADALFAAVDQPYFDFNELTPVDDATFAVYERFYGYDPSPLDAAADTVETTDDWIKERVTFEAAYPGERVTAYVFLPRNARPPYQTVVYFPSSVAFLLESSENLADMTMLSFLPRAGRALVYPIYKGTYERRITDGAGGPAGIRQRTIWQTQDLQRTVDYIESRDDLRQDALVYMGLSYGGEIAVPVAIEKRFAALVLVGGALDAAWRATTPPEAAPWNFVSRITTPTLLINGRNDTMHHYETGQVPFFEAIDVPAADKKFVVLDAGHVPPWNEVIRYTLDWLDERLGTVR